MFRKYCEAALVLLLVSGPVFSFAQEMTLAEIQMNAKNMAGGAMFQSFDNRFKGVKGNALMFEDYVSGKIYMSKQQIVRHDKINYDIYEDQLLVLRDGKEFTVSMNMVTRFVMVNANRDSIYFSKLLGPDGKIGFFQKLNTQDQVGLYKKIIKTLSEPNYKGAYSLGKDYSEFIQTEKLMLMEKGKRLKEFKNRKTLLEHFPDKEQLIEKFIKQQKINFKDEADLLTLFQYLNQIAAG